MEKLHLSSLPGTCWSNVYVNTAIGSKTKVDDRIERTLRFIDEARGEYREYGCLRTSFYSDQSGGWIPSAKKVDTKKSFTYAVVGEIVRIEMDDGGATLAALRDGTIDFKEAPFERRY